MESHYLKPPWGPTKIVTNIGDSRYPGHSSTRFLAIETNQAFTPLPHALRLVFACSQLSFQSLTCRQVNKDVYL